MSASQPSETPSPLSVSIRYAVWFAILLYVLIAIFLFVFPSKSQAAIPEQAQARLLRDVLGRLDYVDGGKFAPTESKALREGLMTLVETYQLDGATATVYVRNVSRNMLAWAASPNARQFPLQEGTSFTVFFTQVDGMKLAVQNFWIRHSDQQREEFQMVLALPAK